MTQELLTSEHDQSGLWKWWWMVAASRPSYQITIYNGCFWLCKLKTNIFVICLCLNNQTSCLQQSTTNGANIAVHLAMFTWD